MGLVMWHCDIQPLLGVLGGEVTLTSQKHRTKKDLRGLFYLILSPLWDKTQLSFPEESKMGTLPLSAIFANILSPKYRRLQSTILFFIRKDELVSVIPITNFQNHKDSTTYSLFISSPPSTMIHTCVLYLVLHCEGFLSVLFAIFQLFFSNMWL